MPKPKKQHVSVAAPQQRGGGGAGGTSSSSNSKRASELDFEDELFIANMVHPQKVKWEDSYAALQPAIDAEMKGAHGYEWSSSIALTRLANNMVLLQAAMYLTANVNASNAARAAGFWAVGWSMASDQDISLPYVQKKALKSIDCYMLALKYNPKCAPAFWSLGNCVSQMEPIAPKFFVTLPDGRKMNSVACYVEAVNCDPTLGTAWYNLGCTLNGDETVTLEDGRVIGERAAFLAAAGSDPNHAQSHTNLGVLLAPTEVVTLSDGRKMNKRDLFLWALDRNPSLATAYFALGSTLGPAEVVTLKDGRRLNAKECFINCINHSKDFGLAYYNLAMCMQDDEIVVFGDGRRLNKSLCYLAMVGCNRGVYSPMPSARGAGQTKRSA